MRVLFSHPEFSERRLSTSIERILGSTDLLSVATVNPDGTPHINTAFFVLIDGFQFAFVSDPATRHSENLATTSAVAVVVFDTHQGLFEDKSGLQLFGSCEPLESIATAETAYRNAFPDYATWIDGLTDQERRDLPSRYYVIVPDRLKLFDEAEFGEENFLEVAVERQDA